MSGKREKAAAPVVPPPLLDPASMARALVDVPADVRGHMLDSLSLRQCRQIIGELVGQVKSDEALIDTMRTIAAQRPPAYSVHHAGPHRSGTDGSLGGGWTS